LRRFHGTGKANADGIYGFSTLKIKSFICNRLEKSSV